jgi:carbonic anhydrase
MTERLKKISGYKVTAGHYVADACVVWCFDERFRPSLEAFLKTKEITHHDLVSIAGGARTLAKPANEADRTFIMNQIGISLDLHGAKSICLMMHEDCGACGGSRAFVNSEVEERELVAMLESAKESVRDFFKDTAYAGLPIDLVLVKFDGIYELESQ